MRTDLTITGPEGRISVDIAVTNAVNSVTLRTQRDYITGEAAERREREKESKYRQAQQEGDPEKVVRGLGIEVQGTFGPNMRRFFNGMVNMVAEATKVPKQYVKVMWERRLSATLQRYISRQINKTKILQHRAARGNRSRTLDNHYNQEALHVVDLVSEFKDNLLEFDDDLTLGESAIT